MTIEKSDDYLLREAVILLGKLANRELRNCDYLDDDQVKWLGQLDAIGTILRESEE